MKNCNTTHISQGTTNNQIYNSKTSNTECKEKKLDHTLHSILIICIVNKQS